MSPPDVQTALPEGPLDPAATQNTEEVAGDAMPPEASPLAEAHCAEQSRADRARVRMRRVFGLGFVLVLFAFLVLPKIPREQHVRLHFGPGSSRIVDATARIARDGQLDRERVFHFDRGAPPSLTWDFDLPNGTASLEIELSTGSHITSKTLPLQLGGGETVVELAETMGALP